MSLSFKQFKAPLLLGDRTRAALRVPRARPIGGALLPFQLGQLPEHFAYALAPVCAQCREIRVALVEAAPLTDLQAVPLVANQIDGHAHRQVAAHGRIERNENTFGSVRERGGGRRPDR